MHFAVHGDNRRQSAAAQTGQPFKIELAVSGSLAGGNSQAMLQFIEYLPAPADVAGRALTALDSVPAGRSETNCV